MAISLDLVPGPSGLTSSLRQGPVLDATKKGEKNSAFNQCGISFPEVGKDGGITYFSSLHPFILPYPSLP